MTTSLFSTAGSCVLSGNLGQHLFSSLVFFAPVPEMGSCENRDNNFLGLADPPGAGGGLTPVLTLGGVSTMTILWQARRKFRP